MPLSTANIATQGTKVIYTTIVAMLGTTCLRSYFNQDSRRNAVPTAAEDPTAGGGQITNLACLTGS